MSGLRRLVQLVLEPAPSRVSRAVTASDAKIDLVRRASCETIRPLDSGSDRGFRVVLTLGD